MGRIKTAQIKRVTNTLITKHKDRLKTNFEENKKIVVTLADINSKKLKNVIAGYITRLMKSNKD